MASLEIKITNTRTGQVTRQERFEIADELGQQLIAQLQALVEELPGAHHLYYLTRLADNASLVDISLGPTPPPPPAISFRQQHARGGSDEV